MSIGNPLKIRDNETAGRAFVPGMKRQTVPLRALLLLLLVPPATLRADDLTETLRKMRREPANPVYQEELRTLLPTLSNSNDQQLAVTVYGLGRLLNDDLVGAQKAHDTLAQRFPVSPYLDCFNFDSLASPCHRCNGDGENRAALCDRCKGGRRCVACGGKSRLVLIPGKKNNAHTTFCPDCGGTGRCRNCNGTGRKNADCAVCKGRGLVLNDRKIRQTATGLLDPYRGRNEPAGDDK